MRKFLTRIWNDPVWSKVTAAGIISLIGPIVGLVYGLVYPVAILWICLGILWTTAIYILIAKVRPSLATPDNNARIKKFSTRVRLMARVGAIAIPAVSILFGAYKYYSRVPAKPFTIVVADFASLDGKNYGITENLVLNLREATKKFPDIDIQTLDETIGPKSTSGDAQLKGRDRNAALVLWGWNLNYQITVHCEVIKKPQFLNLRSEYESISGLSMNESFELQARVASDMNHLVLLTVGIARLELKDLDGAIALFSRAILHKAPDQMIDPTNAYFYRGIAYSYLHQYDQALSDFDQVLTLDPLKAVGYMNRALIHGLKGDATSSATDTKKAIELLTQMIERNANDGQAYLMRGIVYANAREYSNAISDGSKAIALNPKHFDALSFRAQLYEKLDNYDQAISDWNKVIELDPAYATAYIHRGTAFFEKDELDRAFADFNFAIMLNPERDNLVDAFISRGNVYFHRQEYDRAFADYNQALRLNPNSAEAFTGRCIVYSRRNDVGRAIAECSAALNLKPDLVEAVVNRGHLYLKAQDFSHALEDYRHAVRLNTSDASVYSELAGLYGVVRQYDNAIKVASRAIELKPDLAQAFCNRGSAYYQKGLYDLAIADFDEAIKLNPNYSLAQDNKARALKAKASK